MEEVTQNAARAIYDNDWERALMLWRSVIDTRGKVTTLKLFRQDCIRALTQKEYGKAESALAQAMRIYSTSFSENVKGYARERGLLEDPAALDKPIVQREPSLIDQRLADDLKQFEALVGKTFQTKSGGIRKIEEIGTIRETQRGMKAGVRIGYYRHDSRTPLSTMFHLYNTEIFLPSTLLKKMMNEDWSEIDPTLR